MFRNTFVEDPAQVLFSPKILPLICGTDGLVCGTVDLSLGSMLKLNFENLFSPRSIVPNSIGFQNIPNNYAGDGVRAFTLTGSMSIGMEDVFIGLPDGLWLPLLGFDAAPLGGIGTNGASVDIDYSLGPP